MANPTTNFGWVMPTSASLVTNLPADFNTFGQAVDTSMSELLGGTTGQVLSKTSNTSMDFTWVTPTDQTPLTTKGDLFTFTTVDARLGVGTNGQILTADSTAATGLKWATASSGVPANATSFISGSQSVSGASYVDLATSQSVTVTTGTRALVMFSCQYENGSSSLEAYMSFGVTGATTSVATDARASKLLTGAFAWVGTLSQAFIITGLTAGSNTFTTKFRMQGGGSMGFNNRYISVIDMGS